MAMVLVPLVGCQQQTDGTWKPIEPKWKNPKWDWWNTSSDTPAPASDSSATTSDQPYSVAKDAKVYSGTELDTYRKTLWPHVHKLQDLRKAYPVRADRDNYIHQLKRNLPRMYSHLEATAPDTKALQFTVWSTYLIWDFMPIDDYFMARARWETITELENIIVPKIQTRQDMAKFVLDYLDGRGKLAPNTSN
ncbi:MAG: hypothetical protein HN909_05925 [Phycisphaerales bacterium]|nr:hypothetical protein [Phycisphaerales bacterium]